MNIEQENLKEQDSILSAANNVTWLATLTKINDWNDKNILYPYNDSNLAAMASHTNIFTRMETINTVTFFFK